MSKKLKKRAGYYRISDIAKQVDRSTIAVVRWEKNGLIPKAKRDSRGWRIYTKEDVEKIVRMAKRTKYFSNQD